MPASEIKRNKAGQFVKGQSGNPTGGNTQKTAQALRKQLAENLDSIIATVNAQALAGCTQSQKMILDRVIPTMRPSSNIAIKSFTPESVSEALTSGSVDVDQANKLFQTLLSAQQYQQNERLEQMLLDVSERLKRLESGV